MNVNNLDSLQKIISLMRRMGENVYYPNNLTLVLENTRMPVLINEGLIKSYDADNVVSFISNIFHFDNGRFSLINPNKNKIYKEEQSNGCNVIIVKVENDFTEKNKLDYYMKKYGWILARIDKESDDFIKYTYEKKFDEEIFCFQLKSNVNYLYHITEKNNLDNIFKKGLRTKAKTNPKGYMNDERLYLFLDCPDKDKAQITSGCLNPVILQIDLNKLNDNFKFHFDPRIDNALSLLQFAISATILLARSLSLVFVGFTSTIKFL